MTATRRTLAAEYNAIAATLGMKQLGLAKDLASAKARLATIKAEAAKKAPKAKKAKVAREGKRSGRGMNFNYEAKSWRKLPSGESMRATAYAMLVKGSNFKAIKALVASEGKQNLETLRYRTLRLIEAVHYAYGVGLTHDRSNDPDTGLIKVVA